MSLVCSVSDQDAHGGTITTGSYRTYVHGLKMAHRGSQVAGDRYPHSGKVVTSTGASQRTFVNGNNVAIEGTLVNCGAALSASGSKTFAG